MTTKSKIYVVRDSQANASRLVRSKSARGAIVHCASTHYSANVASQDELVAHLASGASIEDSTTETAEEGTE